MNDNVKPWETCLRAASKGYSLTVEVDRSDLRSVFRELDDLRTRLAGVIVMRDNLAQGDSLQTHAAEYITDALNAGKALP